MTQKYYNVSGITDAALNIDLIFSLDYSIAEHISNYRNWDQQGFQTYNENKFEVNYATNVWEYTNTWVLQWVTGRWAFKPENELSIDIDSGSELSWSVDFAAILEVWKVELGAKYNQLIMPVTNSQFEIGVGIYF